jgi:hypothetical protein
MSTSWRRLPVRRVKHVVVAALGLGAALAVVGPAAAAAPKVFSAQYSGTLKIRLEQPEFGGLPSHTFTYELTWREHATAPLGTEGTWTIDALKGSVKDDAAPGPCSVKLASNGTRSFTGGIVEQGDTFVIVPPSGGIPWGLTMATPQSSDPACSSVPQVSPEYYETDSAVLEAWAAVKKPTVTFPAKGSHTQPLDFSWHCPDKHCPGTVSSTTGPGKGRPTWAGTIDVELTSRLEFAGPGFVLGSPKLGPGAASNPSSAGPSIDPKALARADLRRAVLLAVAPCGGLTLVLGSQALFTIASPATASAAGLVEEAVVEITAEALGGPLTAICAQALKQIVVDYSVVEHDPPVSRASAPLHLPPCTRWQGRTRAYCRKLEAEATKLVAAERAVLPALKRLESAGTALRNARAKHDAQATASAQAKVKAAAGAVEAARAAARAAGKSAAGTMRAAGVQGKLTRKQADAATAALLDRLAKQGVPTAALRKLAGSALTSAPVDLLAALAG